MCDLEPLFFYHLQSLTFSLDDIHTVGERCSVDGSLAACSYSLACKLAKDGVDLKGLAVVSLCCEAGGK